MVEEIVWNPNEIELVFPCRETLDKKENLIFQNIGDEDILGESMLADEAPKEEKTEEAARV